MSWKPIEPTSPKTDIDDKFISFSGGKVNFSTEFLYQNKLQESSYVMLFVDEEAFKLGFAFLQDKVDEKSLKLNWKNGIAKTARIGDETLRKIGFVSDIIKRPNPKERRFLPKLEKLNGSKIWVISLVPDFQFKVRRNDIGLISSESTGIYRYLKDGAVVYIGKGSIKRRAQEAQRSDWNFDTIEYAKISTDDPNSLHSEQFKWERYFILKFKDENNNQRPIYNRNDGVSGS